jgi:Protein of unknown function (DUF3431)
MTPYNNLNKQLVVAKYEEDVIWLNQLNNIDYVVYNKGNEDEKYISLPNIKRETHTYVYHLVHEYNNLHKYNYIIFTQGNPFDHDPDFIKNINEEFEYDFIPFGRHTFTAENNGAPHHYGWDLSEVCEKIGLNPPFVKKFDFTSGALFTVKTDVILNKPISFYEKCLEYIIDDEKSPWKFERLWKYIFLNNLIDE